MKLSLRGILVKSFLPVFSAIILVAGIAYAVWIEPTANPPGNNVPAPINVGASSQYKSGDLGFGDLFRVYNNVIFDSNVGSETTSPTQKLDVTGDVKGQSGLCIGNDCCTTWPEPTAPAPTGLYGWARNNMGQAQYPSCIASPPSYCDERGDVYCPAGYTIRIMSGLLGENEVYGHDVTGEQLIILGTTYTCQKD